MSSRKRTPASEPITAWAVEWKDRHRTNLQWHPEEGPGQFQLFATRAKCKAYINMRYGYIRDRADLRGAPHHWRMPRPVRVIVSVVPS